MFTRRDVAVRSVGAIAGGLLTAGLPLGAGTAQETGGPRQSAAFGFESVLEKARLLAAAPFSGEFPSLPNWLDDLDREDYLALRYRPEAAIWRGEGLPFQLQLFHRGFIYKRPVQISIVEGGSVKALGYSPELFDYGADGPAGPVDAGLGFSGFRVHAPLNVESYFDEVAVFQGGNTFRAVGKGQVYGLSARSVAVDVATSDGEEVPFFREFWIEKPSPTATELTIYGLLDGESLTGAYKFVVRPGEATVIDVHGRLFIRRDLEKLGLAPLVSMFLYGEDGSRRFDDTRPEIHDSDGLLMQDGSGVWTWRPLGNPRQLAISAFEFDRLAGFGLMQRDRDFGSYEDLDGLFQQRPSAWVETVGEWGPGRVELVEIPADAEIYDNIVCYWVPEGPVRADQTWTCDYRVAFGRGAIEEPSSLGRVVATRTGRGSEDESRRFVVDFAGGRLTDLREIEAVEVKISVSKGEVENVVRRKNAFSGGVRLTFDYHPEGETAEMRAALSLGGERVSEIWSYQWRG